jgi:predicted lipoprotein with Yx(FWY)xxD motif
MKNQFKLLTLFCLALVSAYLTSCTNDPAPVSPPPTGVGLTSASILTDNKGQTLYFFTLDATGQSTCASGCDNDWPIFYVEDPTLDANLSSSDFGEITRSDNKKQSTYKGFPLYYFSPTGDGKLEKAGETSGDGVDNVWFSAKANYTVMLSTEQLVGSDGKSYTSTSVEGQAVSTFFVDAHGRTIYAFSNDTWNNNNFTAADLSNNTIWPMFYATIADLPKGISAEDFGEITVFGQKQSTYKGRPLYYFGGNGTVAGDVNRGETRGISFPTPGLWHVVSSATTAAPTSITITHNATLGDIITDAKGRSLYFFTKDTDKTNHFCPSGQCTAVKWPAFYTDVVSFDAASQLVATDFDVITLANNTKQTTYKGWPLYYYSTTGDGTIETAGNTGGDGFNNGLWFVSKPSYSLMVANAQLVGFDNNHYIGESILGEGTTLYFVDGNGRTLYRFNNDHNNTNTFTNGTAAHDAIWPIFYTAPENLELPSSLNRADFGEITVQGQKQLTYKGWPLYYFGGNATAEGDVSATRGKTNGVSFPGTPAPGASGPWRIVFTATTTAG